MVFFLTAALYAGARWIFDDAGGRRGFGAAAGLTAAAILAKPVALVALVPLAAMFWERFGLAGACAGRQLGSSRGRTRTVRRLRRLRRANRGVALGERHHAAARVARFARSVRLVRGVPSQAAASRDALGMLGATMLGWIGFVTFAAASSCRCARARGAALGWLAGALLYTFVVVTVERVDYYLYLFLPLRALWSGGLGARLVRLVAGDPVRATRSDRARGALHPRHASSPHAPRSRPTTPTTRASIARRTRSTTRSRPAR